MVELRIELLGGFQVSVEGRPVAASEWHRRKPAALLKLLALAPGHRCTGKGSWMHAGPSWIQRRQVKICTSRALRHFDTAGDLYERAGQPYWSQRSHLMGSVAPA